MADCRCPKCNKLVRNNCRGIESDVGLSWYQQKCTALGVKDYRTGNFWICGNCASDIYPFYYLSTTELINLSFNSNTECACSNSITSCLLESLPCFDLYNQISETPGLIDKDVDSQLS